MWWLIQDAKGIFIKALMRKISGFINDPELKNIINRTIFSKSIKGFELRFLLLNPRNRRILLYLCCLLSKKSDIWAIADTTFWLVYLSGLLACGKNKKAKLLLMQYVKRHEHNDIHLHLPVAVFADSIGISNPVIKQACAIYGHLEKNRNTFEKIITGKTIAVVGNGPSEAGKGKGREIDGHDLVIRFNNYRTDGFEEDYGSRTDIWIRGFGGSDVLDYSKDREYQYVGWAGDYRLVMIHGQDKFDILWRDYSEGKVLFSYAESELYTDTADKLGQRLPTTGCSTIYTISELKRKHKEQFTINDCYGFSFLGEDKGYCDHYFNDRPAAESVKRAAWHSLSRENRFLLNILTGGKFPYNKRLENKSKKIKIKIPVVYHEVSNPVRSKVFFPVHAGRAIARESFKGGALNAGDFGWLLKNTAGDDTGDNISHKNKSYRELTAMYWVWKNSGKSGGPDYTGLFHCNRMLDFSGGNVYCPDDKEIADFCAIYDIILPVGQSVFSSGLNKTFPAIYEYFAMEHGREYIDILAAVVKRESPEKDNAVDKILCHSPKISRHNILIAKKEHYYRYCEWLFGMLNKIESECEKHGYSLENSCLAACYGEVLLNIYIEWLRNSEFVRIGYLPERTVSCEALYNYPLIMPDDGIKKRVKAFIKKHDRQYNLKNIYLYYKFRYGLKRRKEKTGTIDCVHSLSFRRFYPNGGAGGGGAVLSCQKILLGDTYGKVSLKYSFYEDNYYSARENGLWDLWGAACFAQHKTKHERNTVYITHDYGTAFGLYLMGKRYVLVSHIQGARVEEKRNLGERFSDLTAQIIRKCEKLAFENAFCVCFPSDGAYNYFCNSEDKSIKKNGFINGPVLYNTLYAYPKAQPVPEIKPMPDKLVFFSAGQMTTAKGIDRCVILMDELLRRTDKEIHWIFVGQGPLTVSIIAHCTGLRKKYNNFAFSHIGKCTYPQMQYLHDISNVYLMLHRISIFDLATLEAMNKSKAVVLSDAGGNPEFNRERNIILFRGDYQAAAGDILRADLGKLGKKNKLAYDRYFANSHFVRSYQAVIDNLISGDSIR